MFVGLYAFLCQIPKRAQVLIRQNFDVEIGASNWSQLQLDPLDNACEPEAGNGCAEEIGLFVRRQDEATTIASMQADRDDMVAEGADAVMVFTVNVVRDGSRKGDEPGSGGRL
jgi:hypothetical protein